MRKIAGFLIALSILFLTACSQPEATSPAGELTQAPTPTSGAPTELTEAPTAEPTQVPAPTEIPPTPTEEPPAADGPFISSGVNLGDLADKMRLDEILTPDEAALQAFSGEDILQYATDAHISGLYIILQEDGPFTVFVPTYRTEEIPAGTFMSSDEYVHALFAHVVRGLYLQADLLALDGQSLPTLRDDISIQVSVRDGTVYLNDSAMIIDADILGRNGVIQVIDQLLVPAAQ
jgi:hypothetical protein